MKLTQQELAEIREREVAATPGPWQAYCHAVDLITIGHNKGTVAAVSRWESGVSFPETALCDAEFIKNSRTDIPSLLSHIAALEAELLDAAELHLADESTIYQLENRIVPGLRAELADAREVIDDAPHFEDCAYINGLVSSIGRGKVLRVECSCWKRNTARSKP
jgi:hypothetical protein